MYGQQDPAAFGAFDGIQFRNGKVRILCHEIQEVGHYYCGGNTFLCHYGRSERGYRREYHRDGSFEVKDAVKLMGGKVGHIGTVISGMIKVGDMVALTVNAGCRSDTCKNHSATHLLQKALRERIRQEFRRRWPRRPRRWKVS